MWRATINRSVYPSRQSFGDWVVEDLDVLLLLHFTFICTFGLNYFEHFYGRSQDKQCEIPIFLDLEIFAID